MTEHTEPKAGRWTYCATQPDEYSIVDEEWFDTKDEAVAACRITLAGPWKDYESAYVVRCGMVIDAETIAPYVEREIVAAIEDSFDGRVEEDAECGTDDALFVDKVPDAAATELREFLVGWIKKHALLTSEGQWMCSIHDDSEEVTGG